MFNAIKRNTNTIFEYYYNINENVKYPVFITIEPDNPICINNPFSFCS